MNLFDMFSDPFIRSIILRALAVGTLVSFCAALLGVSLVLKRYSMIGDGLSHVGFLALSLSAALGLSRSSLEVSIPVVLLAALLLMRLSSKGEMQGDAATAIVSTGAVAVGVIIFSLSGSGSAADMCNSLFGSSSVVTLTNKDLYISIILSLAVIGMYILYYNKIFAVTFDEPFARASGIKAERVNLLLSLLVALVIVIGMKLIGAIMISALVVFPAMSAMKLFSDFKKVIISAGIISVLCFSVGFLFGCAFSLPTGPSVVIMNVITLLIASIVKKART